MSARTVEQLARSLGVTIRARAHRRVSVPTDGRREVSATDRLAWQPARGVEYVLTGGSSYGRGDVADAMARELPGAVVVHVSPFAFVRLTTATR